MPDTLRQCGIVVDIAGDTLAKGVLRVTVGAAHVPESVPAVLLQEVCRAGLTESPLFLPYLVFVLRKASRNSFSGPDFFGSFIRSLPVHSTTVPFLR